MNNYIMYLIQQHWLINGFCQGIHLTQFLFFGSTILSENTIPGSAHAKNWNFSCSLNGRKWDTLHSMKDSGDLNGASIKKQYPVKSLSYYSRCKIEQTGAGWNSGATYMFAFQQIDVNANFILVNRLCTNNRKHKNIGKMYFVIFFALIK